MRKGWQQRRIKENAWGLHFDRWYLIAPSGNKYHFYRSCYFPTIFVPTTYHAVSTNDKDKLDDTELIAFRSATGKKVKHHQYLSFDGNLCEYNDVIDDRYDQALQFIYETEEKGGFAEQNKINSYLDNNKEMNYLFSKPKPIVKYNSMP